MSEQTTRCSQCGAENRSAAKFCAMCGATLRNAPAPAAPEAKKSRSALPLVLIIIFACLFLTCLSAAGIGFLAWSPLSPFAATPTFTPTNTPTFTPTFTPTLTPTLTPTATRTNTPLPTFTFTPTRLATPTTVAKACPSNPAYVSVVNLLTAGLTLDLSGPQTYRIVVPAGTTANVCLVPGNYAYTATATGYNVSTNTKSLDSGEPQCWWWFGSSSSATRPPCNAPSDRRQYTVP